MCMLACPRCSGRLRLIALIHQPAVVQRILTHLELPSAAPAFLGSRDPPEPVWMEPA